MEGTFWEDVAAFAPRGILAVPGCEVDCSGAKLLYLRKWRDEDRPEDEERAVQRVELVRASAGGRSALLVLKRLEEAYLRHDPENYVNEFNIHTKMLSARHCRKLRMPPLLGASLKDGWLDLYFEYAGPSLGDVSAPPNYPHHPSSLPEAESWRLMDGPRRVLMAAELGQQVMAVLAGLHAAGITHRDVKPANFCIDLDGRVRAIDLGLAHLGRAPRLVTPRGAAAALAVLDAPLVDCWTEDYAPPEAFLSRGMLEDWPDCLPALRREPEAYETAPCGDVWAAGVSLYELATGVLPFEVRGEVKSGGARSSGSSSSRSSIGGSSCGGSDADGSDDTEWAELEALGACVVGDAPWLHPWLPWDLKLVLQGALAKSPDKRWSAAVCARALEGVVARLQREGVHPAVEEVPAAAPAEEPAVAATDALNAPAAAEPVNAPAEEPASIATEPINAPVEEPAAIEDGSAEEPAAAIATDEPVNAPAEEPAAAGGAPHDALEARLRDLAAREAAVYSQTQELEERSAQLVALRAAVEEGGARLAALLARSDCALAEGQQVLLASVPLKPSAPAPAGLTSLQRLRCECREMQGEAAALFRAAAAVPAAKPNQEQRQEVRDGDAGREQLPRGGGRPRCSAFKSAAQEVARGFARLGRGGRGGGAAPPARRDQQRRARQRGAGEGGDGVAVAGMGCLPFLRRLRAPRGGGGGGGSSSGSGSSGSPVEGGCIDATSGPLPTAASTISGDDEPPGDTAECVVFVVAAGPQPASGPARGGASPAKRVAGAAQQKTKSRKGATPAALLEAARGMFGFKLCR
ncbi:hypothetical protein Rsub_11730 [Raphidocelis subcapitata]|uniref:Protein kinase domain-containing protein n=1 Tax=Raphidocelis subcapitata TaxID=307507 RepID=A0A2V0PGF5_9CHLO|nr:hypothetical protein Rsub_11730 [Raphidocelis subcapitata]|eukprot:GBF98938.1 hypothetical protein Rsub_11730 [Raphidocelis subcapitata]